MFYVKEISTDASSSSEESVRAWSGVIHRVIIEFPPGCAWLVKVTIWQGGHQIYPSNEGTNIAGDGARLDFRDYYKLNPGYNKIIFKVTNDDDTYSHKVRIMIGVLPEWVLSPQAIFRGIRGSLTTLLRRIGVS